MSGQPTEPTAAAATEPASSTAAEPATANSNSGSPGNGEEGRRPHSISSGAGASETKTLADDLWAQQFTVHKSIRYHAKRRATFDRLHAWARGIIAIAGSAAFVVLFGDPVGEHATNIAKFAAMLVAVAATFEVVGRFPEKARDHDRLYERFCELAAKIAHSDPEKLTAQQVRELTAERLILEKSEPTSLDALNVICHNEEAEAQGVGREHRYAIGWLQRLFAPLCTFPWFNPKPQSGS